MNGILNKPCLEDSQEKFWKNLFMVPGNYATLLEKALASNTITNP